MNEIEPVFNNLPYIFFSYPHENAEKPLKILSLLQKEGFRVWYDDHLQEGERYNQVIDTRIKDCAVFMPVLSREYCASDYCCRELIYALESLKKPMVPVFLEHPSVLQDIYPPGLGLWMSGNDGIVIENVQDLSFFRRRVRDNKILSPCNQNSISFFYTGIDNTKGGDRKPGSKTKEVGVSLEPVINQNQSNTVRELIASLLEKVMDDIDLGKYKEAQKNIGLILQADSNNADALYYKLLADHGVSSVESLGTLQRPVDPESAQHALMYQDPERRKAILDALDENQKYQNYLIATSHMSAHRYLAALEILDEHPDFRDSAQRIAKCKYHIAHAELLKRYKNEIQDRKAYLTLRLQKERPDDYEQFVSLCKKVPSTDGGGWLLLIIGVLLAITGVGLIIKPGNLIVFGLAVLFSIASVCFIMFLNRVAGFCGIAIMGLLLCCNKFAAGIFILVTSLILLIIGVVAAKDDISYKKALKNKDDFYEYHIKSFEDSVREEIESRYSSLMPKERVQLESVDAYCTKSLNSRKK